MVILTKDCIDFWKVYFIQKWHTKLWNSRRFPNRFASLDPCTYTYLDSEKSLADPMVPITSSSGGAGTVQCHGASQENCLLNATTPWEKEFQHNSHLSHRWGRRPFRRDPDDRPKPLTATQLKRKNYIQLHFGMERDKAGPRAVIVPKCHQVIYLPSQIEKTIQPGQQVQGPRSRPISYGLHGPPGFNGFLQWREDET